MKQANTTADWQLNSSQSGRRGQISCRSPPPPGTGLALPTFSLHGWSCPSSPLLQNYCLLLNLSFGKTGSQCPGSQSQGPNTPSFSLLSGWSHVETQNISQFSKKNFSSLSLSMVPELCHGSGRRRSSGICPPTKKDSAASIPGPIFLHFLSLALLRKPVFHAQTKPARRR